MSIALVPMVFAPVATPVAAPAPVLAVPPPPKPFPGWINSSQNAERAAGGAAEPQEQGQREVRRVVEAFKKTRVCRFYPRCNKGDACRFAHAPEELRSRPNMTKTRMCAGFYDGRCKLSGDECNFAHGEQELRAREVPYFGVWKEPSGRLGDKTPETSYSPANSNGSGSDGRRASKCTLVSSISFFGSSDGDCTPREGAALDQDVDQKSFGAEPVTRAGNFGGLAPGAWSGPRGYGGHTSAVAPCASGFENGDSASAPRAAPALPPGAFGVGQTEAGRTEAVKIGGEKTQEAIFAEWMERIRALSIAPSASSEAGGRLPTHGECMAALMKAMPEIYED
mmetsp:Transcript_41690/g.120952  ORF Transcript_41690/g.120952 Transcript_41690/m.120952 type:complete len:338 (+) Transcript_41690:87-1100(+)